jgi:hypothetical protein
VEVLGAIWPFGVGLAPAALRAFCASSPPKGFYGGTKHQWLYLHQLDSIATVRRLVGFYVQQHNEVMPHSAFNGLTPDEVYFGKTDGVVESLADRRSVARRDRIATNRQSSCRECPRAPPLKTEGRAA